MFLSLTATPNDEDDTGDDCKYNGVIINTNVLGQSDMGVLKVLTLFQDLNNPLFHQVDVKQFLDGCGWALERFHCVKVRYCAFLLFVLVFICHCYKCTMCCYMHLRTKFLAK